MSKEASNLYVKRTGKKWIAEKTQEARTDPDLIAVIRELGEKANGEVYGLKTCHWVLVDLQINYNFKIIDNDGYEEIHINSF